MTTAVELQKIRRELAKAIYNHKRSDSPVKGINLSDKDFKKTIANEISNHIKTKKENMDRGYQVLKLSDLARRFGLPPSSGYKTEDYLKMVIHAVEIEGYKFIQFLQLIDVLYVIIQKPQDAPSGALTTKREIDSHYETPKAKPVTEIGNDVKSTPVQEIIETPREMNEVKKRDHLEKNLDKNSLPWKTK